MFNLISHESNDINVKKKQNLFYSQFLNYDHPRTTTYCCYYIHRYTHNTETSSLKYKPKLHISLTQNTHISLCV